ncbi:MAG TPA: peptide chain release factor N(5)-glutamine methyltransferase [Stellaceae bacterium]|nr:peptide chain release factor N(5)-glutamine methyltransferase [Stellaceae bacterium]
MTVAAEDGLAAAVRCLAAAGIDNPRREARLLQGLAAGDDARFADYVRRRAAREPYSRIRGRREFWSLDLELSPDTLDPRPDSETLIEAALVALPDRSAPLRVLDLGTGTGALLLALLSERPNARGIGIDVLPGAVEAARRNAAALGLATRARFVAGDWAEIDFESADVILANPPYIPESELAALPPEVARFDPRRALAGGGDGLAAYRALAPVASRTLRPGGWGFFEAGAGQARAVVRILTEQGLEFAAIRRDLAGHERCVVVRRAECGTEGAKKSVGFRGHPV